MVCAILCLGILFGVIGCNGKERITDWPIMDGPPEAGAATWDYAIGPSLKGRYFSSACMEDPETNLNHWYAGSYMHKGCLARSDEWGNWWESCWRQAECEDGESISAIRRTVMGKGMDLLVEDHTAKVEAGWPPHYAFSMAPASWGNEYPWALGGPEMERYGWIGLSDGRPGAREGSCLGTWDFGYNRWACFTPKIKIDGIPPVLWDATYFQGKIVIGASMGHGAYKNADAGRVIAIEGEQVYVLPFPKDGGVVRVLPWNGKLILTTITGHAYETEDLVTYKKLPYENSGTDMFLLAYNSQLILHSRGKVWIDGDLVLDIPNVDFLSLAVCKTPDNKFRLGGPITLNGESFSRSFIAFQKEEQDAR